MLVTAASGGGRPWTVSADSRWRDDTPGDPCGSSCCLRDDACAAVWPTTQVAQPAFYERMALRSEAGFANPLLSATRQAFGGQVETPVEGGR